MIDVKLIWQVKLFDYVGDGIFWIFFLQTNRAESEGTAVHRVPCAIFRGAPSALQEPLVGALLGHFDM